MTPESYTAGMTDGETAALAFADTRTRTLPAPAGSKPDYASGWRVGFGNVRNLLACTERLAAGDRSYRDQAAYMRAFIAARHPGADLPAVA
jgi:hypothetical protein